MCTLCAALNPDRFGLEADQHLLAAKSDGSVSKATPTGDQLDALAGQLTDGYWQGDGEEWRAFDAMAGDTLSYDVTGLTVAARELAVLALSAWSDVTGLKFAAFVAPATPAITTITETADLAASAATSATMSVNQALNGTVGFSNDEDWVAITLQAGRTYTITLDSRGAGGVDDAYLRILNASGVEITANDDRSDGSFNSELIFRATTTGTHYLAASAATAADTGGYRLQVTEGRGSAHITFDDFDDGAYSTSDVDGNTIRSSFVNVQTGWSSDPVSVNSYWFQTYVHEIGHALGLGHAGNYNGDAVWGDQRFSFDSWQASVMSYFSQEDNPNIAGDDAYLATVMAADIIAIQDLYGNAVQTRHGNTVYGSNANVTGYLGQVFAQWLDGAAAQNRYYIDNALALTIYDTGGVDRLDFSSVGVAQTIRLTATAVSSVAGIRGNLVIAKGVVIENASGGRGADFLSGNGVGNQLIGNAGADTLNGGGGNDRLLGGAGNDRLVGGLGADVFQFGGGRDLVVDFGNDVDTLAFSRALWGGGNRSAQQVLNAARVVDGDTVFTFGTQRLTVEGVASKAALLDDIVLA